VEIGGLNMSEYLSAAVPFPEPRNQDERSFWAHCAQKRLAFRRCTSCGHTQNPPLPLCPRCQSTDYEWINAPDHAELYTYTVVHHVIHGSVSESVPYIVAVVMFPELGGLRFVTNLVDVRHDEMVIGMRVSLVWEAFKDGVYLPRFAKGRVES